MSILGEILASSVTIMGGKRLSSAGGSGGGSGINGVHIPHQNRESVDLDKLTSLKQNRYDDDDDDEDGDGNEDDGSLVKDRPGNFIFWILHSFSYVCIY